MSLRRTLLILLLALWGTESSASWSMEGELQAGSVAGPASPLVGAAAFYRLYEPLQVGLRGFLPWSKPADESSYAIQAVGRIRVSHGSYSDLFLEPEYALNFNRFVAFSSYGASVGVLTQITEGLSVGVSGGLEVAKAVVDSVGLETRSDFIFYPKITFLASFQL